MSSSIAKDIYDGLKKIITLEDRFAQVAESVKQAHVILQNHAERLAKLEGKFELVETSLARRRRRLPSADQLPALKKMPPKKALRREALS
jgi:hypothetical protein